MVSSDRTRGNAHKVERQKFCINLRGKKKIFILRATKLWHRLPREVVEPPLDVFRTHLSAFLCHPLKGTCFSRTVALDDLRRTFQTPMIL